MGFFDKMAQKADEKLMRHVESFLLPGEEIQEFIKGNIDWIAVTNKRYIVSDKELNLTSKSTQDIFSFKVKDITGLIVDMPLDGIIKEYKLGFSVGRIVPKITFYKKEDCMSAYHKLAELLYL